MSSQRQAYIRSSVVLVIRLLFFGVQTKCKAGIHRISEANTKINRLAQLKPSSNTLITHSVSHISKTIIANVADANKTFQI
jgi:hypothetical protein